MEAREQDPKRLTGRSGVRVTAFIFSPNPTSRTSKAGVNHLCLERTLDAWASIY